MSGHMRTCAGILVLLATAGLTPANAESNVDTKTKDTAFTDSAGTSINPNVIPSGLLQLPERSRYYSPYAFVVDKNARRLAVWKQTSKGLTRVADFPADLGKNTGDKRFSGDHKTPEGIYFLKEKLEGSSLDFSQYGKRAFTTDYPNFFDRLEGKTGYGIWLHAVPDQVPLTRGSRGCVVVRNEAILNLSQFVTLGRTPILIQNKTDLIERDELEQTTQKLNSWLDAWKTAWETKNIESYIASYSPEFQAMRMNRDQWKAFKAGLAEKYQRIQVRISRPAIFADRQRLVVRFLQEYTSDHHSDFGEKTLWLKKNAAGEFQIIGEAWAAESSQIAREEIDATTNHTKTNAGKNEVSSDLVSGSQVDRSVRDRSI